MKIGTGMFLHFLLFISQAFLQRQPNPQGDNAVFLGHKTTPSKVLPEENAYILNLKDVPAGGYIDALALENEGTQRLDANPSACAHLVNHSKDDANTEVVSFVWADVIPLGNSSNMENQSHSIPNVLRSDEAPRYVDGNEMFYYESDEEVSLTNINNCGAVFCAKFDIPAGQELLLDYDLRPPLPPWAANWYKV